VPIIISLVFASNHARFCQSLFHLPLLANTHSLFIFSLILQEHRFAALRARRQRSRGGAVGSASAFVTFIYLLYNLRTQITRSTCNSHDLYATLHTTGCYLPSKSTSTCSTMQLYTLHQYNNNKNLTINIQLFTLQGATCLPSRHQPVQQVVCSASTIACAARGDKNSGESATMPHGL
jgi:hypothetical protein